MARMPGKTEDYFLPWDSRRPGGLPSSRAKQHGIAKWPIASEAMAIDLDDLGYAQEVLAQSGVKTDYDKLGRPILRDRAHRKAHAEAMGFYDRNGSYGDPSPKHFNSDYQKRR